MIADDVGRLAVRHLPDDRALVEADGRDRPVGRPDHGQALDVEDESAEAAARGRTLRRRRSGIGAGVLARAPRDAERLPREPVDVVHVRDFLARGRDEAEAGQARVARGGIDGVGLRIVGRARPVRSAAGGGEREEGQRTLDSAQDGGRVDGAELELPRQLHRLRPQRGREVDQVLEEDAVAVVGGRLGRNGLGRRVPLAGDVALLDRPLLDRPDGPAGDAVEDVDEALLARLGHRLDRAAVDGDVGQDRRRRDVVVPERMVHELEVPLARSGTQVDAHQGLAEEVVSRPVAPVEVVRRGLHREVDQPQLLVDRDLRPHARVAVLGRGAVQPRVVAELARRGDRVKDPEALARAHVERPYVSLVVLVGLGREALPERGADEHDVLRHHRGRLQADLAGHQIDVLIDLALQVHGAVLSEAGDGHAVLRVERDQAVAGRHVEDPLLRAVGPVGEAAPGELARRVGGAGSLVLAVRPEQLARDRIQGYGRAARSRRRVEDAVHHERRPLEFVLRPRPQAVRLEPPGNLEIVEVAGVDLVQRGVPAAPDVAGIGGPLAVARAFRDGVRLRRLAPCGDGQAQQAPDGGYDRQHGSRDGSHRSPLSWPTVGDGSYQASVIASLLAAARPSKHPGSGCRRPAATGRPGPGRPTASRRPRTPPPSRSGTSR